MSGGERKRTNIGMELIIEPQVLFLDEPTTGLDAHTAVTVVQLLKECVTMYDVMMICAMLWLGSLKSRRSVHLFRVLSRIFWLG